MAVPTIVDVAATTWDNSSGTVSVTLGATPSNGQGLILSAMINVETADPTWPAGFTNIGKSVTAAGTHKMCVAAKVAASESSGTYSVNTTGWTTFDRFAAIRLGSIDTTNFVEVLQKNHRLISTPTTHPIVPPVDAPYTDHMALFLLQSGSSGAIQAGEVEGGLTIHTNTGDTMVAYTTSTTPRVVPDVRLQTNLTSAAGVLIVPGTGSVLSGDLADFAFDNIVDSFTFNTGYTLGNTLASHAGWSAYQISGSGVPTIDSHSDHHAGYVVDGSAIGSTFVNLDTNLGTPDHWGRLTFFTDTEITGTSTAIFNTAGVMLRSSTAVADAATDGYVVALQRHFHTGQTYIRIYRMDNGVRTQLATTADLNASPGFNEAIFHTIHGKIEGTLLTGYLDGEEVVSYDTVGDGTIYSTGNFVGLTLERGRSSLASQPLIGSYRTGTFPSAGTTYTETLDTSITTTTTVTEVSGRVETLDASLAVTTTLTDLAGRVETLATSISSSTVFSEATARTELTDSAITATTTVVDALGAVVPDAVTDLAGIAGDSEVALTWTAPADGGAAITDYVVQYREES